MTFNKEGNSNKTEKIEPYDFSNVIKNEADIKTVFRQTESRDLNFIQVQEKQSMAFFMLLFKDKRK